jgi:hypothetical protein
LIPPDQPNLSDARVNQLSQDGTRETQRLLVDFGGPMIERLQAQAALVVGGVFVCLATLASRTVWLAAGARAGGILALPPRSAASPLARRTNASQSRAVVT